MSCSIPLMHVKDEQAWTQQLTELEADEMSRLFKNFILQWGDTADRLYEVHPVESQFRYSVSKAFEETEQTLGFLSVEWLGQMLLVLVEHWVHGDELWESLSVWERRMVETAAAIKIVDLQDRAASAGKDQASALSEITEELD